MATAFKRTGIRQETNGHSSGLIPQDVIGTRLLSYDGIFRSSFRYPPFSLDKLTAQKGYDTADDMFTMAACRAPFNLKRSAILAEGWEVVPAVTDPYDARFEEAKTYSDFVNAVLADIRSDNDLLQDFRSVLWQVMRGIWNGFCVAEIGYRVLDDGDNAGKLGLDGIYLKRPKQIGFDFNPATMQIMHLTSYTPGLGLLPGERIVPGILGTAGYDFEVPISKCILYTHDPDAGLPHGNGDWRACYKHWWAIDNVLRFWAVAIERWGAPVLIAQADPTDATAWNNAQAVLDSIRQSAGTLIPEAVKYELVSAPAGIWEGFRLTVDWHARQIALNIQHSTLAMYEGEHGATSAGSATHKDASEYLYNACRRDIESVVRAQLFRRLCLYNFGTDFDTALTPCLSLGGDDPGDVFKLAQAYDLMIQDGVIGKSAKFIRESLGMPPMDPDEQAQIEADQQAEQEAQQQLADARNSGTAAKMSTQEYTRVHGMLKEALLTLARMKASGEIASFRKIKSGQKISKAEANYREAQVGGQSCGTCSMFRDGTCTLVEGKIEAGDVCDYWDAKEGND